MRISRSTLPSTEPSISQGLGLLQKSSVSSSSQRRWCFSSKGPMGQYTFSIPKENHSSMSTTRRFLDESSHRDGYWGAFLASVTGIAVANLLLNADDSSKPGDLSQNAETKGGNVNQTINIYGPHDPKTGASIKELNVIPRQNRNFVDRENEEEKIAAILKTGKICYLMGAAGLGKTQLALNYVETHKRLYRHVVFINCEDSNSLQNSISAISRCLVEKTPSKGNDGIAQFSRFIDKANQYWQGTNDEGILIIIDNIDDERVYEMIKPILETNFRGNLIATGRYELNPSPHATVINVGPVTIQESRKIFKKALSDYSQTGDGGSNYSEFFDKEHDARINTFLTNTLESVPCAIQLVAAHIKMLYPRTPPSLEEAIRPFEEANMAVIASAVFDQSTAKTGYSRSVNVAINPNIDAIRAQMDQLHMGQVFDDLIYFLAFMPPYQSFSIKFNQALIETLKAHSPNKFQYSHSEDDIRVYLTTILTKLKEHSLIQHEHRENDTHLISVHLLAKWAIRLKYLYKYEDERSKVSEKIKENETSVENWSLTWVLDRLGFNSFPEKAQHAIDKQRFNWFIAGVEYLKTTENQELLSLSYFNQFMSSQIKSKTLQAEIFNLLTERFQDFTNQGINTTPTPNFFAQLTKIDLDDLRKIIEGASKAGIKDEQVGKALLNLSMLYLNIDPRISTEILALPAAKNGPDYFQTVGNVYYEKAKQSSHIPRKHLLERAKTAYLKQLDLHPLPTTFHNLALCYQILSTFSENIQDPSYDEKIEKYYLQAIKSLPFDPNPEENYSSLLKSLKRHDESEKHHHIATILRSEQFSEFSKNYQNKILEFLRAEGTFFFKDFPLIADWTMDDRGVFFGSLINENKSITTLNLYACHLNDQAIEAIAKNLETNSTIEKLHLEYNSEVTDRGVIALAKALKYNSTLKEISLVLNKGITDKSALALIKSAKSGMTINLKKCPSIINKEELFEKAEKNKITLLI